MNDEVLQNQKPAREPSKYGKARRWAFTWHDYTEATVEYLSSLSAEQCDYLIFGFELTDDGRPHLQGYIEFRSALGLTTVKSRLDPVLRAKSKVHLEVALASRAKNIIYCKKDESADPDAVEKYGSKFIEVIHHAHKGNPQAATRWARLHEMITEGKSLKEIHDELHEEAVKYSTGIEKLMHAREVARQRQEFETQFLDCELYDWQLELIERLKYPADDRAVIWIFDSVGNKGKSWLSRYLVAKMNAARFENASSKDIALAYNGEPIVIFDFSRTVEERLNYQIIESIKNGILFSPKYNSCTKFFKSPHIVCFANWAPNLGAMSRDRWRVKCIDDADCTRRARPEAGALQTDDDFARGPEMVCGNTELTAHQGTHDYTYEDNIADGGDPLNI